MLLVISLVLIVMLLGRVMSPTVRPANDGLNVTLGEVVTSRPKVRVLAWAGDAASTLIAERSAPAEMSSLFKVFYSPKADYRMQMPM